MRAKIVTKDFSLLFLFSIAICSGMNMLNVIVPLYVTETLKGTAFASGLMTTFYTVSACLSRPVNGILTERFGRRTLMLVGSLIFTVGCLLGGLLPSVLALAFCRILMGLGYSAASTSNNTASMDVIPSDRMAEGIGYFGMSQSVASAIGPAVASLVILSVGNQVSLLVVAAVSFAALLLSLFIRYESAPEYKKAAPAPQKASGGFFEKTAILPSLFQGLFLFIISCPMCFMPLYIVFRGQNPALSGWFFVISSIAIVVVRLLFSNSMNRLNPICYLIPGYLSLIVLCILLPYVNGAAGLMFCGLIYGLSHGFVWMVLGSEAVRNAAPHRRAAANATFYFSFDAGIGLGASFWGVMIDHTGYDRCFSIIIVAAALLLFASIPVFRKKASHTVP